MNTDWSEEFETMAMKHYQLSSIPLWLICGIWTDPRCMVSQPSLGFAKWVSLTWKYLLGRDCLFYLFFQWVFCCDVQGSCWARSFFKRRAEIHSQLAFNCEGKAAYVLVVSYSCTHAPIKNVFMKWNSCLNTIKKLHQDHLCHCLPSFSLIHILCQTRLQTHSDLWKYSWTFKYDVCSPSS